MRRVGGSPVALWSAFVLVHLWLGLLNLYGSGLPLGDVTIVYRFWSDQVFLAGFWVGIHSVWVYPILAIFPMLAAELFGPGQYASTWLSMITVLDAVAFAAITGWVRGPRHLAAAWWWLAFLLLLGPIAMGRIDSVTVPLGVLGLLYAATRPRLAALLLTLAAWIKVWPGALLVAMVTVMRARWRILATALGTSAVVAIGALAAGGGGNLLSFVTQQTGRGLQVEAPVSTIWLWQAFAGVPGAFVYYDQRILTWQVTGDGVGVASALMTPLLALVVVAVALVAVIALRRGADPAALFVPFCLALVVSLIAFNKVGSPQFIGWIAVPIVAGLASAATGGRWRFAVPAALAAAAAGLTQLVYPYLYGWLLGLHPLMLVALTVRNALLFALLAWAVHALWIEGGETTAAGGEEAERGEPSSWPPSWSLEPAESSATEPRSRWTAGGSRPGWPSCARPPWFRGRSRRRGTSRESA